MTARITAAEARKLGIDAPAAKRKQRVTRRTVRGVPYYTICTTCRFECRTMAAENRHLDDNPTHCRYELVLGT